jgi:hypothetical protein
MRAESFGDSRVRDAAFKILKFQLAQALDTRAMRVLHGVEPQVMIDATAQQLVMRLKVFLVQGHTEQAGGEKVVEYPADWWQAFRARWFDNRLLRWHLRRHPVRMAAVRVPQLINVTRVCPHLPVTEEAARHGYTHIAYLVDEKRW